MISQCSGLPLSAGRCEPMRHWEDRLSVLIFSHAKPRRPRRRAGLRPLPISRFCPRPRRRTFPFEALRFGGFVSPVFPQKKIREKAAKPRSRQEDGICRRERRKHRTPTLLRVFAPSREISLRTRRHRKGTHVRFAQDTAARWKDTRPTVLEWWPQQDAPAFWAWPAFGISPGRWIVTLRA